MEREKRNQILVQAAVVAGAAAAGYGLGYFLGRRKKTYIIADEGQMALNFDLQDAFPVELKKTTIDKESLIQAELNTVKPEPVIIDHEVYIQKGTDFVEERLGWVDTQEEETPPVPEVEIITQNVFAGSDIEWDYDKELEDRANKPLGVPYILHKDEFFADEKDFTQITVTYYAGDNIMADEQNSPVYNHDEIVGPLKFGHGSGDPKVFYVRNEKLKCEYEILLDPGQFSVEVLGLEIEHNERAQDLKHSAVSKFRPD